MFSSFGICSVTSYKTVYDMFFIGPEQGFVGGLPLLDLAGDLISLLSSDRGQRDFLDFVRLFKFHRLYP